MFRGAGHRRRCKQALSRAKCLRRAFPRPFGRRFGGSASASRLSFETLEPRLPLAVEISEFLADNETGITDFQGDRTDWIELQNDDIISSANVGGMYLTDDAGNLTAWQIPAGTMIGPGGYRTIFASSKNLDGSTSGGELHANFNLSNNGGYLALVAPDGSTILSEFDAYPEQFNDISFGTGITASSTSSETFVGNSSTVTYLVPTGEDAATDDHWREIGFNDASWGSGTGGVGKDVNGDGFNFVTEGWIGTNIASEMSDDEKTAYIRYEFDVTSKEQLTSLQLDLRFDDGFIAYLNNREVVRANFGEDFFLPQPAWNSDAGHQTTGTSASGNHVGEEVANPVGFDLTPFLQFLVGQGNVLAFHGVNTASTGNTISKRDFLIQPALTAGRATGADQVGYMIGPTPGGDNGVSTLGFVGDTDFSVDRGFYTTAQSVAISTATPGAIIRYTTDGSRPTLTNGTTYTVPISITTTTTLRAAAFRTDYTPTNVDTQTYIFLDDVIGQNASYVTQSYETWGTDDDDLGGATGFNGDDESDWDMDPNIVNGNETAVMDALLAIPTMSLVLDWDDLFSGDPMPGTPPGSGGDVAPSTEGIYIVGSSSERAASLEYINPDSEDDRFQVDTVVEIQGHSSTLRWRSDKLSFQVKFKPPYADSVLSYPLFAGTPDGEHAATEFDTLILDAGYNYTFHHASNTQHPYAKFVPDQVVADLQNQASGVGPHGEFVHLYINGLYWGLYNVHERPDDSFAPRYYGGREDDYYVVKHANQDVDHKFTWVDGGVAAENAYVELLDAARAVGANPTNAALYAAVEDTLDIDQFIDYMIVHFYGGNATDWPHNNWYATFNHVDSDGKWRFHEWDQEHAFDTGANGGDDEFVDLTDYNPGSDVESPHELLTNLIDNDEFRLRFADRVQALMRANGPLTEANAQATYQARVDEIFEAVIAESARWGDNRVSTPYTQADFNATATNLMVAFFPVRTNTVGGEGGQFDGRGWLVTLDAPEFNQYGGEFTPGFMLTMAKPSGSPGAATIWYTFDGTDPRDQTTNEPGSSAVEYTGTPIELNESTRVQARIFLTDTGSVDDWSPVVDKTFAVDEPYGLRVVELMYNPAGRPGEDAQLYEYIELLNTGSMTISLAGVHLGGFSNDGFTFNGGSLDAGERIVVPKDPALFQVAYPAVNNVTATGYSGNLGNGGELVTLFDPVGTLIQSFEYGDSGATGWPDTPDGNGHSLVYIGPFDQDAADPSNPEQYDPYDDSANWAASLAVGGSPAAAEPAPIPGDYDLNGSVQQADYLKWKADFGMTVAAGTGSDGNGNGVVDAADFTVWRDHLGQTLDPGPGSSAAGTKHDVLLAAAEAVETAAIIDPLPVARRIVLPPVELPPMPLDVAARDAVHTVFSTPRSSASLLLHHVLRSGRAARHGDQPGDPLARRDFGDRVAADRHAGLWEDDAWLARLAMARVRWPLAV
jgi:hypothetical protein